MMKAEKKEASAETEIGIYMISGIQILYFMANLFRNAITYEVCVVRDTIRDFPHTNPVEKCYILSENSLQVFTKSLVSPI